MAVAEAAVAVVPVEAAAEADVLVEDHRELLVATVCVRITCRDPPGTCAWNTSNCLR